MGTKSCHCHAIHISWPFKLATHMLFNSYTKNSISISCSKIQGNNTNQWWFCITNETYIFLLFLKQWKFKNMAIFIDGVQELMVNFDVTVKNYDYWTNAKIFFSFYNLLTVKIKICHLCALKDIDLDFFPDGIVLNFLRHGQPRVYI